MIIEELYTKLGFKVDESGLDRGKSAMASFKASATKFLGGLAIGAGLVSLAKTGLQAAMEMENLSAQFKVMTGSAEGAKKILDDIAKFAASTPFDKIGLADAGKTLMAFGIQADDVIPTLRMLGDVAGPSAERLKSLALVFGQIKSAGKLQGQDLLQLINQGFNPLNVIAEKTGMSMTDLKDAMAKGAISADMVTAAFEVATSEGGLFYKNLEEQSKTLAGRLSTLKDNFVTALQNMAEAFLPLLKRATDVLVAFDWRPIVVAVQSVAGPLKTIIKLVVNLAQVVRTLGPVLVAVFGPVIWKSMAGNVIGSINSMVTAFKGLPGAAANGARSVVTSMKSISGAIFGAIGVAWMLIDVMNKIHQKSLNDLAKKFEEQEIEDFKTGKYAFGMTPEEQVESARKLLESDKKRFAEARASGDKAAIAKWGDMVSSQAKIVEDTEALYYKVRGVYYDSVAGGMDDGRIDPKTASKAQDKKFEQMMKDLEASIKKSEKATKDNAKATQENTKALKEKPFNIADLARQSFDAQFNVKLKQMMVGAST